MMLDCRAAAAQILAAVCGEGQSLERQLARLELIVRERDRSLLRELCYGSLRWQPLLIALLAPLLKKPLKERDNDIVQLMVIGAYQLLFLRIPPHAAISSAVEACRPLDKKWAAGLINAVLRTLQRDEKTLFEQVPAHARAAHPLWLWQALKNAWPEQAEAIFAANNSHPPLCLRVNHARTTTVHYLAQLQTANIAAEACALAVDGVRLESACDVATLPGFAEGLVSVQDEAAQLAAYLLDIQPRQRVLDACCAPGGKTCHMLELQPTVAMYALDVSAERLQRVAANLQRLQLAASHLIAGDALSPASWWDGKLFDRILLDAPCSGTGVIRRHPDIKLLRSADDIARLAELQYQLLTTLWPLLGVGGVLLYATCSSLPQENTQVIERFLHATASARELPIAAAWGITQPVGRQLLPQIDGNDGFYYARLEKYSA
jgi:16S rRNA (cytosine967-C5)-methyltransferase